MTEVKKLHVQSLEPKVAPAPIWVGEVFPGKPSAEAHANASENAAFKKFTDPGDGGYDLDDDQLNPVG